MATTITYAPHRGKRRKDDAPIMEYQVNAVAESGGTFEDGVLGDGTDANPVPHGYVARVVVNPGSPSPTADCDITITDASGVDIMGGQLADVSATISAQAIPLFNGGDTAGPCVVFGPLTVAIADNSVEGAVFDISVVLVPV